MEKILYEIQDLLLQMKEAIEEALSTLTREPSRHHFNDAATATVRSVTERPANLSFLEAQNPTTSPVWIQIFDHREQGIALGTEPPAWSLLIPPGDGTTPGYIDNHFPYPGVKFDQAISYAVTTTVTGSTAPASNCTVNAGYVPSPELL